MMTSVETRTRENFPPRSDDRSPEGSDSAGLPLRTMTAECWLGSVLVATTGKGIRAVLLGDDPAVLRRDLEDRFPEARLIGGDPALERLTAKVVGLIEAPGDGPDLPLDPWGTAFQQRVWQALRAIPAGSTTTYSQIAARIGAPKEAYAVGEACAANMIAVAIPCHRVLRKDGALAGYRWGVRRKRALLEREGAR